ncbi:UNVERIFIED_CONTAM: Retrovirus-related Pol polyprotein from transposon TNT 1-94 [Sesamum radiatum]|uniref:Retrovirus-related Pol polyprotein from transposon TNT 1-94 n=1 Tax=Sesamum radiatum TaxID=300843 RepID=A0AAW2MDJ3_SESRA
MLLEESREPPQQNNTTSFEPLVPTNGVPILCRSTRISRPVERYRFVRLTNQLDNDPKTYREVMSDIDSGKWLEAMKSEMDSMGLNQVWTLVDPSKGLKPVGCKWVIQRDLYESTGGFHFCWRRTERLSSPKDMGESSYILGIKIYRDRSRRMLGLTQSSYIEKVLKKFKTENSNKGFLPMRHGIMLSKKESPKPDEDLKRILDILYASAVESIQYVVPCTRPDVAYALSVKSRYQLILGGYSNASFQSDDDNAKSQSGFVFKLNGGVVAWKSSKQAITADSTTEAEYIAALEAAKEAV